MTMPFLFQIPQIRFFAYGYWLKSARCFGISLHLWSSRPYINCQTFKINLSFANLAFEFGFIGREFLSSTPEDTKE